ncbi:hypothetical protein MRX96_002806 [Rhipicephalus microplus]
MPKAKETRHGHLSLPDVPGPLHWGGRPYLSFEIRRPTTEKPIGHRETRGRVEHAFGVPPKAKRARPAFGSGWLVPTPWHRLIQAHTHTASEEQLLFAHPKSESQQPVDEAIALVPITKRVVCARELAAEAM